MTWLRRLRPVQPWLVVLLLRLSGRALGRGHGQSQRPDSACEAGRAAGVGSDLAEADEAACMAASASVFLLQNDIHLHVQIQGQGDQIDELQYLNEAYWDFSDPAAVVEESPEGCSLKVPAKAVTAGPPTKFAFGKCPLVVPAKRRRLNLQLDLLEDGTTAPGYNPSLIRLPEELRAVITDGEWLAALRVGDERWPTSVCNNPAIKLSLAAWDSVPPLSLIRGASMGLPESTKAAAERSNTTFRQLPRTFIAVLDEDLRVLTRVALKMHHGEGPVDDASVQDARLHALSDGRVLITFQPYYLQQSSDAMQGTQNWRHQEIIALLQLNMTEQKLYAWIDRKESRAVQECPEKGYYAPGPKKNLGLFQHKGSTFGLDWIYPTRVGQLRLEELDAARASDTEHFTRLCYGYGPMASPPRSPWAGLKAWRRDFETEDVTIHNGTPLIWLEELGEFLGVGHVRRWLSTPRSKRRSFYLHQFYTVKGSPDTEEPFKLSRVGSEFCLGKENDPGKCEAIQVITSLALKDSHTVQIGYGVMDCESFVSQLDLRWILQMLTELQ